MFEILKILFTKKKNKNFSFKVQFQYFQSLLEANDEAHKYMSDLAQMIFLGKPFSKGNALTLYKKLYDKTYQIAKYLVLMSNGKHKNLLNKAEEISGYCNKILSPRVYCPEGWECPSEDCHICTKVTKLPVDIPYYYNINEVTDEQYLEVGNKMSRLGELKNKLGLPVPEGFCLTVRFFEEIMLIEQTAIENSKIENRNIENSIEEKEYKPVSLRQRKDCIFYDLDFNDIKQVRNASMEAQELIISTQIPKFLEDIVLEAYDRTFGAGVDVKLAVRSSARGEDSKNYSFAGLHRSELNISRDNLIEAIVDVLISKYSHESVVYRYISGLRDEDMPMSVGCIQMIDSVAAGVLFTADPHGNLQTDVYAEGILESEITTERIIIQAVHGLGSLVVEGQVQPQEFIVEHSEDAHLIRYSPGNQNYKRYSKTTDGISKEKLNSDIIGKPCLNQEQITELVNYALKIEHHFNSPQDIEWAIDITGKVYILQARPLNVMKNKLVSNSQISNLMPQISVKELDSKYLALISQGECAGQGIAFGPVCKIANLKDIDRFQPGAILVAKKNLPEFARLIPQVSGVITDIGSTTGHLSIIAREQNIPILTNTINASSILEDGMLVTLYADKKRVYKDIIQELVDLKASKEINTESFRSTPIYRIWHRLTRFLFKLNLTNPNSSKFSPEHCMTFHDIIRFAHEISMKEMFSLYESARVDSGTTYKLKFEVPLDIYIINLGNGLMPNHGMIYITPEEITSKPFRALIKGMTTPGIEWAGPLSVDFKGFVNIMMANMSDSHKAERDIGSRSYALLSENYLNFFSRLGYHFSRLDALASDDINRNYINFNFRGGAADPVRRARRATAIRRILESYNFTSIRTEDNVISIIRKVPEETILSLLVIIGKLMGAVRNTDVTMLSDKHIDSFVKAFLAGDPAPARSFGCN
jgi:pyruvate, water dikinase